MKFIISLLITGMIIPAMLFSQCDKICLANAGSDVSSCCGGVAIGNPSSNCQNNSPDPNCPIGLLSFSWSPITGLNNSTICNPTANPATTTTYTLTVTFTCGLSLGALCCCDGCGGTTCSNAPGICNGTEQRTDQVVFTRTTPNCCRLIYPEKLPEVDNDNIKVYPIPNNGLFHVDFETDLPNSSINVFDIEGKLVFNQSAFSQRTIKIDIANKPKGIYFIQVKSNEDVICYKKIIYQ